MIIIKISEHGSQSQISNLKFPLFSFIRNVHEIKKFLLILKLEQTTMFESRSFY